MGDALVELPMDAKEQTGDVADAVGCNRYITGLRAVLNAMAMAGAFLVDCKEAGQTVQKHFAHWPSLMKYLADAEAFVLRCRAITNPSTKSHFHSDQETFRQLRKIDESIRTEWARATRDMGRTITDAISESIPIASSMWLLDPTHVYQETKTKSQQPAQHGAKAPGKATKGKTGEQSVHFPAAHPGTPALPPPPGKGGAASRYGAQWKTCRADGRGYKICKFWQDARGCNNSACKGVYCCDISMANGQCCCDKRHNRESHSGPKMSL